MKITLSDVKEGLTGGELARVKISRTLGANGDFRKARHTDNPKLLFGSLDEKESAIANFKNQVDEALKKKTGKGIDENSDNRDYWRYVAQIAYDEQIKTFNTESFDVAREANPLIIKTAEKVLNDNYYMREYKGKKELSIEGWSKFLDHVRRDRNLPDELKADLKSKALGGSGIAIEMREAEDLLTDKSKTSSKLEKLATNRVSKSVEMLEEISDRKQNTYRRASMADYAKDRFELRKTNAETLSRLASANKKGQLSSGMKNVSQLKQMEVIEKIDRTLDNDFTSNRTTIKKVFDDPDNRVTLERLDIRNTTDLMAALIEYRQYKTDAPTISKVKKMERELIGDKSVGIDYFPTPPKIANKMVEKADIRPGMRVLEPSAGNGAIADAIKSAEPSAKITTNEISSQLVDILKAKGYDNTQKDFLSMPTDQKYDRIVMNPPFGKGSQGIDQLHIRHAYEMLAPGGKLVGVASEGSFSRSDRNAKDFQQWVDSLGGEVEKVEPGAFMSSINPTGAATRIVVINKPQNRI